MGALASVLSLIPLGVGWFSVSVGSIALLVYALRRGFIPGLVAGLIWGLMHFALGNVYYLSVPQVLIEYVLAFMSVGFAGLLSAPFLAAIRRKQTGQAFFYAAMATVLGIGIRYIWHYIAGFLFWGSYAPEGQSPYLYSLIVNGSAGLMTGGFVIVLLFLLIQAGPKIFLAGNNK